MSHILPFADLQQATGYTRLADVERCLEKQGVRFLRGKDGIWTTLEAVNAAVGVRESSDASNDPYSPESA